MDRSDIAFLLKVSRPFLWPIFPLGYIAGVIFSGAEWSLVTTFQAVLLSFPYSLMVYGLNDIYDQETDMKNSRKTDLGINSYRENLVKYSSCLVALMLLFSSFITINLINLAAVSGMILGAVLYSVPPMKFKSRPVLDALTNGIGYVLIPSIAGYSLGSNISHFPSGFYWVAFSVMGAHLYAAALDYRPDKEAGEKTTAVFLGRTYTLALATVLTSVSAIFSGIKLLVPRTYLIALSFGGIALRWRPDPDYWMSKVNPWYYLFIAVTYLFFIQYYLYPETVWTINHIL